MEGSGGTSPPEDPATPLANAANAQNTSDDPSASFKKQKDGSLAVVVVFHPVDNAKRFKGATEKVWTSLTHTFFSFCASLTHKGRSRPNSWCGWRTASCTLLSSYGTSWDTGHQSSSSCLSIAHFSLIRMLALRTCFVASMSMESCK